MPGLPGNQTSSAPREPILRKRKRAVEIDEKTYKIKGLLTGPSGGGKSTGAVTFDGPELLLDLENRSASLIDTPDLEIINIDELDTEKPTAWKELIQLKDELWAVARSEQEFPWTAIVVDGCTRLGRYAMSEALQLRETQGKQAGQLMKTAPGGGPLWENHYAPQMHFMSTFIMQMIPLPCHVIFTAHLDFYENKDLNTVHIFPKFLGKVRSEVSSWFNETYFCEYSTRKKEYIWKTIPFGRYDFLKSSLNTRGKYWSEDLVIDLDKEPAGFMDLLQRRFQNGPLPNKS